MKKIFILTGEPSGDKLASTVISKLQQSNFDNFSNDWCKEDGPIILLHSMNETRLLFIKEIIFNY